MSLFWRAESRAISVDDVPWGHGGQAQVTGVDGALRLIPVYAATSGIADDVAVTPLHAYRGDEKTDAPQLLTDPGVFGLDLIAWLHQMVMSLLLRGMAVGLIVARDRAGAPAKVVWVHPDRVGIEETSTTQPVLRIDGQAVNWVDVIYVPAAVLPGSIVGLSPVQLFRLQLTKGRAAQQFAADFFDRGVMPPGVLRNTAKTLRPGEGQIAKSRFRESVAGRDIFVTGSDWTWEALTIPDDDVKFLDTIRATATEVAAIYRVAPEDIGGTSGESLTYRTLEMNELRRVRRAILPWARRCEAALTANMRAGTRAKFNLDALVRADLLSRMQAHEVALRAGLETNTEGRALEDKPPLTDAEWQQWQNTYGRLYARRPTSETSTTTGAA